VILLRRLTIPLDSAGGMARCSMASSAHLLLAAQGLTLSCLLPLLPVGMAGRHGGCMGRRWRLKATSFSLLLLMLVAVAWARPGALPRTRTLSACCAHCGRCTRWRAACGIVPAAAWRCRLRLSRRSRQRLSRQKQRSVTAVAWARRGRSVSKAAKCGRGTFGFRHCCSACTDARLLATTCAAQRGDSAGHAPRACCFTLPRSLPYLLFCINTGAGAARPGGERVRAALCSLARFRWRRIWCGACTPADSGCSCLDGTRYFSRQTLLRACAADFRRSVLRLPTVIHRLCWCPASIIPFSTVTSSHTLAAV